MKWRLEVGINILVTGAQFDNKGAESMLFVVADEMKKRFPDSTIYFATGDDYDESQYTFKKFIMSARGLNIAMGGLNAVYSLIKGLCIDAIKICIGRRRNLGHFFDVKKQFRKMDLMIDVSGFNLGRQWSEQIHRMYLNRIELAKRHNIPVYLMPQSFGPFDYDSGMDNIMKRMVDLLPYPELIFAREKEGYDDLIDTFSLNNVILSTDLVLQNTGIDWRNVFTKQPVIDVPKIDEEKVVGIIPNQKCFSYGDKNWNLKIYSAVIDQLLADSYKVVIFRHSKEDFEICQMINEKYNDDGHVQLESKEFSCLEYDEYVKQFQFIICSRFHGIVHAYRNGIPAIALGWAVKYQALAQCVNQEQYAFDITERKCTVDEIVAAVRDMEKNIIENGEIIRNLVKEIQKDNCFDQIQISMSTSV